MLMCVAGKNRIAVDALQFLFGQFQQNELVVVPNRTDSGDDNWQPSLIAAARSLSVPIVKHEELYDEHDLVLFSLEYDQLLSPDRFRSQRLYNIHFSLLPAYKGMYTSAWPILNGETHSGVTLHEIDAGIDTGKIIAQARFPIDINHTARDLYFNYVEYGIRLFRSRCSQVLNQDYRAVPQASFGASYYSAKSIDYGRIEIDFRKTAFEVHNQIRAFCFPEFQLPTVHGHRIAASRICDEKSRKRPGCLVNEDRDSLRFSTVDYDVLLLKAGAGRARHLTEGDS